MNLKLKFLPLITKSVYINSLVLYLFLTLITVLTYKTFGIVIIIVLAFIFTLFILFVFNSFMSKYYLELDKEKNVIVIHQALKNKEIDINKIKSIEVYQNPREFIFSITDTKYVQNFALSSFWATEEPPIVGFLKDLRDIKPFIQLGENANKLLKGELVFQPWSTKMYMSYYIYFFLMLAMLMLTLIAVNILK